jgi:hypothetical protein
MVPVDFPFAERRQTALIAAHVSHTNGPVRPRLVASLGGLHVEDWTIFKGDPEAWDVIKQSIKGKAKEFATR